MPADYLPNNGSQLERAIRAAFIAAGAASAEDCYVSNDSRTRTGLADGITDILALSSTTNEAELSGNEKWIVRIQNKYGAAVQPGETSMEVNRIAVDKRVGRQMNVMLQSNNAADGKLSVTCATITTAGRALAVDSSGGSNPTQVKSAAENADMSEFTCLFVRFLGSSRGQPEDGACAWVEVRNFEITACPANVD